MAERATRVARAQRLVRLQKLMLEAEQSRLSILKQERGMLGEHAEQLLRQMSAHAAAIWLVAAWLPAWWGHIGHRDAIVGNLADLQAGVVQQAEASLRVAENHGQQALRGWQDHQQDQAMEDVVERMLQSASLPKG
jgi:hypothetical protein